MRITKKLAVAASVAGLVALGAGTAAAYWTTSGGGSGNGVAAANVDETDIDLSIAPGIYPGGSRDVSIKVTNPNTESSVHFDKIVQDGLVTFDEKHLGCAAADFTFDSLTALAVTLAPNDSAPGGADEYTTVGKLNMANNLAVSQDACKGATITLALRATS